MSETFQRVLRVRVIKKFVNKTFVNNWLLIDWSKNILKYVYSTRNLLKQRYNYQNIRYFVICYSFLSFGIFLLFLNIATSSKRDNLH